MRVDVVSVFYCSGAVVTVKRNREIVVVIYSTMKPHVSA